MTTAPLAVERDPRWLAAVLALPILTALPALALGPDLPLAEGDWLASATLIADASDLLGRVTISVLMVLGLFWAIVAGVVAWRLLPPSLAWAAPIWALAASPMAVPDLHAPFWLPLPILSDVLWRGPALALLPMLLWPGCLRARWEAVLAGSAAVLAPSLALLILLRLLVAPSRAVLPLLLVPAGMGAVAGRIAGLPAASVLSGDPGMMLLVLLASFLLVLVLLRSASLWRLLAVLASALLAAPFSWLPLVALALYGLRLTGARPTVAVLGLLPPILAAAWALPTALGTGYVLWAAPAGEVRLVHPTPNAFSSHTPMGLLPLDQGRLLIPMTVLSPAQASEADRIPARQEGADPQPLPSAPSLHETLWVLFGLAAQEAEVEAVGVISGTGVLRPPQGGRIRVVRQPVLRAPVVVMPSCMRLHRDSVCGTEAIEQRTRRMTAAGYTETSAGPVVSVWRKEP